MTLTRFGLFGVLVLMQACEVDAEAGAPEPPGPNAPSPGTTTVAITVDATGYHPPSVTAPAGQRAQLVFTRTSDEGCGQQLVFPSLDLRRDLPLNEAVTVDVLVPASGTLAFTCGMNMLEGSIVAQ